MLNTNTLLFKPTALPQPLLDLHKAFSQQSSPQAAWDIIKEYFFFFGTTGIQADMWQLLSGTLTNKEIPKLKKAVDRHNLIFFYEFTLMFADAVQHLLAERQAQVADK